MADLLGQLFAYTEVFDMETRPELLLLQKTMVVVEGVARSLDPELNIWTAAEPIAREWVEANLGVAGRLREAGEGAELFGKVVAEVPRLLERAESTALALADMARGGFRLDDETVRAAGCRAGPPKSLDAPGTLDRCAGARRHGSVADAAGGVGHASARFLSFALLHMSADAGRIDLATH